MEVLSRPRLACSRVARPSGRSKGLHVPCGTSAWHLRMGAVASPPGIAFTRPAARVVLCHSQYPTGGDNWNQSCTKEQRLGTLEQLLKPYGVQTVRSIRNHPEHADVLETLVVLATLLDPEDHECLHKLINDYPELADIPAQSLVRTFDLLDGLPPCYGDLDRILLAAHAATVLPLSYSRPLVRLAHDFYNILNDTLPAAVVRNLSPSSPFPEFRARISRLATILNPHAALVALEEYPELLDYAVEEFDHRFHMLYVELKVTPEQASKVLCKAPALLLLKPDILFQRLDEIRFRAGLDAQGLQQLIMGEPRVIMQDLGILEYKWNVITALCSEVPVWAEELEHSRSQILVQVARCNVVMLEKLASEISDGTRMPGTTSLTLLLYLERQYWDSRSELPPHCLKDTPPKQSVLGSEQSDDEEQ